MKIIIAGVMMDTNIGDEVIAYTFEDLLQKYTMEGMGLNEKNSYCRFDDGYQFRRGNISEKSLLFNRGGYNSPVQFTFLDFYGRSTRCEDNTTTVKTDKLEYSITCNIFVRALLKVLRFISHHLGFPCFIKHLMWYINPNNKKRLEKLYREEISGANLIVFAGGGIIECSSNHDYYHYINSITEIAEEYNVPVCFNAVGKVFDPTHTFGWGIMRQALTRDCVKSITCRDSSEWINENCLKGSKIARTVPCCAIVAADAFGVHKKEDSKVIGIGVIRGNIYTSYGKDVDEQLLLNLYLEIIQILVEKGEKVCLFTNGYSKDIMFEEKLFKLASDNGIDIEMLERPQSADALVNQIAGFKGIITARLHSCIVAYSLKIPAVAIAWTDKINDFMNLIDTPQAAINIENLNARYIVEQFYEQMNIPYNEKHYLNLKDQVNDEIKKVSGYID